jgi:signal transduction histidine kinase
MPLTEAMNRLLRRLEESFRREREFTDNAAHELRTPLAAMKTQTQVLAKKLGQQPDIKEGFENLNVTIDRTHHLVEQLLSLARLQNQTFKLLPTDLSECLQQEIHELAPLSARKGQSLNLNIAEDVLVMGNADTLSMLLRNLIDNAIKYTPDNEEINISLTHQGQLNITDTGPGIQDKDKVRVFERFVRTDKTGKTGSGLGLSIATWIAGIHGVSIQLQDHQPRGLTVAIEWGVIDS